MYYIMFMANILPKDKQIAVFTCWPKVRVCGPSRALRAFTKIRFAA